MASKVDLNKNPVWVKRMEDYFDRLDLNKNGFLTIEEIEKWASKMHGLCKATPQEIENLGAKLREFWGEIGLLPGKQLSKKEFIQGLSNLGRDELERKSNNEKTLYEKLNDAFYDVVDINNDGTVTLEEVSTVKKACDLDPKGAEAWFKMADKNKNGKIEREELNRCEFNFFFRPEDESTEGLFGGGK